MRTTSCIIWLLRIRSACGSCDSSTIRSVVLPLHYSVAHPNAESHVGTEFYFQFPSISVPVHSPRTVSASNSHLQLVQSDSCKIIKVVIDRIPAVLYGALIETCRLYNYIPFIDWYQPLLMTITKTVVTCKMKHLQKCLANFLQQFCKCFSVKHLQNVLEVVTYNTKTFMQMFCKCFILHVTTV